MELTEENKRYIDSLDYRALLSGWRFAPVGSPWFQGETGDYWAKVMSEKRKTADHVQVSKDLGW